MKRWIVGKANGRDGSGPLDWEAIVARYQGRLERVAFLITADRAEAEDATQQAFLKGIGSARAFRREAGVYTWLYRILVNQCIDQMKQRRRQRLDVEALELAADPRSGPEGSVLSHESSEIVRREVMKLEPRQRVAIVLRHFEEMSYEEIAQVMGCPVGTVRSRLANGREILRSRLASRLK